MSDRRQAYLKPFIDMVRERTGFVVSAERHAVLERALSQRMEATGSSEAGQYLSLLARSAAEFSSLMAMLTINETYFFREPQHFSILVEDILPQALAAGDDIRILSAGCSSGEEPYSIAIAITEHFGPYALNRTQIMGIDIDEEAVALARAACYSKGAFRAMDEAMVQRYFHPTEDGQGLSPISRIKKVASFKAHNLYMLHLLPELSHLDAIFYRNVSIYFSPEAQRQIFQHLASMLRPGGAVFLSSTETFFHSNDQLQLLESHGLFYYRKEPFDLPIIDRRRVAAATPPAPQPEQIKVEPAPQKPLKREAVQAAPPAPKPAVARVKREDFDLAMQFASSKNYLQALSSIDAVIAREPVLLKAQSLKASILLNMGRVADAKLTCDQVLLRDQWDIEALMLRGLIARHEGDSHGMVDMFKAALYLSPGNWLAHFYLAEAYALQGERKLAVREYKSALRGLERGRAADHGLALFPFSFSTAQIQNLCKRNIQSLEAQP